MAINNIAPMLLTIEIGAVHTSNYDPKAIDITTEILNKITEFFEMLNNDNLPKTKQCKAYKAVKTIHFPRDSEGNIDAVIHRNLDGKDFQPINHQDPIFELMDGSIKLLSEPGQWYPIFINESAYYEKDIAFYLAQEIDF